MPLEIKMIPPVKALGAYKRDYQQMVQAANDTLKASAQTILDKGRAAIASAGYSRRWQMGLRADVTPGKGIDGSIHTYHRIGYATIFETGGTIRGKPLLWLPLPTVPQTINGRRMSPRNFVKYVGPLFSIRAPGKQPMLGAMMQGTPGSRVTMSKLRRGSALSRLGVRGRGGQSKASKGLVPVPVFIGVTSVTIKKHWNVLPVIAQAQANMPAEYARRLGAGDAKRL